jgi:hypothetical protein
MSELLKKVAKLLGVPENLMQRSAEARADASGKSPEEVLQSWSGGEAVESVKEEGVKEEGVKEEGVKEEGVKEEGVKEEGVKEEGVEEECVEEVIIAAEKENTKVIAVGIIAFILFSGIFTLTLPLSQVLEEAEGRGSVSAISDGKTIYSQEGCQNCHSQNVRQVIPDAGIGKVTSIKLIPDYTNNSNSINMGLRRIGPDLSTIGDREPTNNSKWLKRYLTNPSSIRPNIPHPKYNYLTDGDLDSLIEYLIGLREVINE